MKHLKLLTLASVVPIIMLSGITYANQKNENEFVSDTSSLNSQRLIEPCLLSSDEAQPSNLEIIPIDDCDGGGGGGGGPYRAPSTPSNLTYLPYTNGTSMKVSWDRSNGYGYPVQYKLYESKNNGPWTLVYSGYSNQKTLTGKTQSKVRYRVMAYNTNHDSPFRYGSNSIIKPFNDTNLYDKYGSVLTNIDQKNANYKSTAASFKSDRLRAKNVGQTTGATTDNNGRFFLGDGYDLIRGALKETCLNVEHNDFEVTQHAPILPTQFGVTYINNNNQLAQELNVSGSGKIGFSGDDFSLGLSGEKDRFVKSAKDETHVRFVVKFVRPAAFFKLRTPTDAIYPELVSNVLSPNDDEAKADFRERCGDQFISNVHQGAALYMVFSFDSKKYSYEERENAKAELGLKIGDFFSVSGSGGSSSSLQETIDRLEVSFTADQVGGPAGLAASIDSSTNISYIGERFNQFVQDTNPSNWAAINFTTANYQRPTVYNAYSHAEIFADYRGTQGPLAQMKRWLDISVQHKERCDPWTEYGQGTPTSCGTSQAEISIAMDTCRDTREWQNCSHPLNYSTGSLTNTNPGSNLYSWLTANVKNLKSATAANDYHHHVHKGSKLVDDETCLPSAQCFTNIHRGSGPGIGKGFFYTHGYYDNPRGGSREYENSPKHCAKTSVFLKTGSGWFSDTTADWWYSIDVEGVCPEAEAFTIVP